MRKECVYAHPTVCIITPIVKLIRHFCGNEINVLKVYCIIRLQIFTGEKKKNFYFIADDICLFILVKLKCLEKQD